MDWKYKNEIIIKNTDPDCLAKIDKIASETDNKRGEIHFQYQINKALDLKRQLQWELQTIAPMITTFEILLPRELLKPDNIYSFEMPDGCDTRLIISGLGDKPLIVDAATFSFKADTLVVRNFQFDSQEYRKALTADVGKLFVGEDLFFINNHFKEYQLFMAEPLIVLKSHAKDDTPAQYLLRNVSFIHNESTILLELDNASYHKFNTIEFDHVTIQDNRFHHYGVDVSVPNVFIRNSIINNNHDRRAIVNRIPHPRIVFSDSNISEDILKLQTK